MTKDRSDQATGRSAAKDVPQVVAHSRAGRTVERPGEVAAYVGGPIAEPARHPWGKPSSQPQGDVRQRSRWKSQMAAASGHMLRNMYH